MLREAAPGRLFAFFPIAEVDFFLWLIEYRRASSRTGIKFLGGWLYLVGIAYGGVLGCGTAGASFFSAGSFLVPRLGWRSFEECLQQRVETAS